MFGLSVGSSCLSAVLLLHWSRGHLRLGCQVLADTGSQPQLALILCAPRILFARLDAQRLSAFDGSPTTRFVILGALDG
jgi:hypothetical protein